MLYSCTHVAIVGVKGLNRETASFAVTVTWATRENRQRSSG